MKENIKLFESLQAADGYVIKDIPFITTVRREEVSLEPQNLHCNEEDKKLKREGNIIVIAKKPLHNVIYYKTSPTGHNRGVPYWNNSSRISGTDFINSAISNEWNQEKQVFELTFEDDITEIPERAFYNTDDLDSGGSKIHTLEEIILPSTVIRIGENAFGYESYYCKYSDLVIKFTSQNPPSLEDEHGDPIYLSNGYPIGGSGGWDFSIDIPKGTVNNYLDYDAGWELLKPLLLSKSYLRYGTNSNTILDTNHIAECFGNMFVSNKWDSYDDTGTINFYKFVDGTAVLPASLFANTDVNYIDSEALDSFGAIGTEAFSDCYYLENITIPSSITTVGDRAFSGAGIGSITIPSSVTSVGDYSFDSKAYDSNTGNYYLNVTINSSKPSFSLVDGNDIIYAFGTVGAGDDSESQSGSGSGTGKTLNIYVPANAVDTFKNADAGWEYYADYIKAIGS